MSPAQAAPAPPRRADHAEAAFPALALSELHSSLSDPTLSSMNLLNEVTERFPDAVSFAPGRPVPHSFVPADLAGYLASYCEHVGPEQARNLLFQYGRTKGLIHELIAANLSCDENIEADPESIVVTGGCQEALFLLCRALRESERDVLLAVSPTYVGVTGAARLVDLPVLPVRSGDTGIDLDDFVTRIEQARAHGLRPRGCYLVPDFANPTGISLSMPTRRRLLELAADYGVLLLEDNPYGFFGDRMPTLKSLDRRGCVIYLGSYAKTVMPGARIGFVVAEQPVTSGGTFADELAKIKSMVSVNTSPIAQAVIGGKLLRCGFDLRAANATAIEFYGRNLRLLLDGLASRFPRPAAVTWNQPSGGFFVVLSVPFEVDDAVLEHSARRYGVIWTPMHHFYGGQGGHHQLRLSCSLLTPDRIDLGLDRLAALITDLNSRRTS
ncbi:MAG TPA: PLP-dependent aminotransferase family protein [Streptosporangiaceae bacterium]|nr:PLP-dependent aminotransferase family protein [Streptosporangiaceae bacterium]